MVKWFKKKTIAWWYKHFLGYELLFSILLTLIIAILVVVLDYEDNVFTCISKSQQILYGSLTAVFGALLGFVITGLSILLTINSDNVGMKAFKESSRYKEVFKIFISTSRYLAITSFLSLIGLLYYGENITTFYKIVTMLIAWGVIITIFRVSRCIWVLEKIIDIIHPPKKRN